MRFISLLKKIGVIAGQSAPELLSVIHPPLGALVGSVLNSVLLAEAKLGQGNGEAKKAESLNALQIAVPLILRVVESATGRQLANPDLLRSGLDRLNDAMVDILNAFEILPKKSLTLPEARTQANVVASVS